MSAERELREQLENLEARIAQVANVAAQHGDEHADLGRDPIIAATVEGHSHADPSFPSVGGTNTSVQNSFVNLHTVALPPSIQAGDLLIVLFGAYTPLSPPTPTWPSGWTQFFTSGSGLLLAGAYRLADGTEDTSIPVTTATISQSAHNSYRISGATDPASQAPQAAIAFGISGTPNLSPTGGEKNYLWLAAGAWKDTNPNLIPAGYSGKITATSTASDVLRTFSARLAKKASSENPGEFGSFIGSETHATIAIHPTAVALAAPTSADYLVGSAQDGLSAEIVVGAVPGGELGGTWAAPTVDAVHSGSAHRADRYELYISFGSSIDGLSVAP